MADLTREEAVDVMADALADTVDIDVPWSRYAEAALDALLSLLAERGWQVVPVEPDAATWRAAGVRIGAYMSAGNLTAGQLYAAMLAAAPAPLSEETPHAR